MIYTEKHRVDIEYMTDGQAGRQVGNGHIDMQIGWSKGRQIDSADRPADSPKRRLVDSIARQKGKSTGRKMTAYCLLKK